MKAQKFSLLPLSLYEDVYSGRTTLVELAAKAGQMGYDAIDINEYMIKDLADEELMALRRALPLPVLCLCAYSDFTSPDPSAIREELARGKENIRKAQLLGCLYVRLTAGQARPDPDDDAVIRQIRDCFEACCRSAETRGPRILMENHLKALSWKHLDYNFDLPRLQRLAEALSDLPVGFNFDTANAWALGDWKQALQPLLGRIEMMHINDIASLDPFRCAVCGEGQVCIGDMLAAVYDSGFDGWITIEEASFTGWDGPRQALENMRGICGELVVSSDV